MKTIIITDSNNETVNVQLADTNENGNPTTLNDLCESDAMTSLFDMEADDIKQEVTELNETAIPDTFRRQMFGAELEDGATVTLDIEFVNKPQSEGGDNAAEGTPGTVTVCTSGGLNSCTVAITNGRTTVRQAIFNDTVRQSSGQNDTQLSSCSVMLNEVAVDPSVFDTRTVNNGDVITLTVMAAHTKG